MKHITIANCHWQWQRSAHCNRCYCRIVKRNAFLTNKKMVWTCQYTWPAEIDWQLPKGTLCPKITSKLLDGSPIYRPLFPPFSTTHYPPLYLIVKCMWTENSDGISSEASNSEEALVRRLGHFDQVLHEKGKFLARFCDAILKRSVRSCRAVERRSWQRQIPSSAAIWRVDASTFKFSVNYCCKMNPRGASGWSTFVRHLIGDKLLLLKIKYIIFSYWLKLQKFIPNNFTWQ